MLQVINLHASYDERKVLHDIHLSFEKGKFYGILGPNGSGKTTLLKVISGLMQPVKGTVLLNNQPIMLMNKKEKAKQIAVLPQINQFAFASTVRETVSIGRYPHQNGLFSSWRTEDEEAVQQAMEQTGIAQYANTQLQLLSGGEQQRVFIAQSLAQQAQILLLDEVTNHLDITHQKQALDIIMKKVKEEQLTVIAIFHDINLASLYCDELILMENGHVKKVGMPNEVVSQQLIGDVYDTPILTYAHPTIPKPQITMLPVTNHNDYIVRASDVKIGTNEVVLQLNEPLKVLSSAVYHAGIGWYTTLINRKVEASYEEKNIEQEVEQYLQQKQYLKANSVVMLTAVSSKYAVIEQFELDDLSIVIMVTAGIGNAIDVSKAFMRQDRWYPGTINTWVIVNGRLTEEAFVQAMMTATEAKVKALQDEKILDSVSNTGATGTGTDSLLIGSTEVGALIKYAGPLTTLGKLIGKGVYEVTTKAIKKFIGGIEDENLHKNR